MDWKTETCAAVGETIWAFDLFRAVAGSSAGSTSLRAKAVQVGNSTM